MMDIGASPRRAWAFLGCVAAIGCSADDGSGGNDFPPTVSGPAGTGTGAPPPPTANPTGTGVAPPPAATGPVPGRDTSIVFSWPEADLTAGPGSCKAGQYQGLFDGIYASPVTFIGIGVPVTGDVQLVLVESMSGEFFDITNGVVSGFANFTIPYRADMEGSLNCQTMQMEGGFLRNGTYEVTPGVPNFFEGPVTAAYDGQNSAFVNGTWTVGEPSWVAPPAPPSQFGGNGNWSAAWIGP